MKIIQIIDLLLNYSLIIFFWLTNYWGSTLYQSIYVAWGVKRFLFISGSSAPEPVVEEEDDDGLELEEEELESVQVSETQFNFFDFIKK